MQSNTMSILIQGTCSKINTFKVSYTLNSKVRCYKAIYIYCKAIVKVNLFKQG